MRTASGAPAARRLCAVDRLLDRDRGRRRRRPRRANVAMIPSPTLFGDRPVVSRDRLGQEPVVGAPERLGRLLAEVRALRGRADEIGEEDRGGAGVRRGGLGGHRSGVYRVCPAGARQCCGTGLLKSEIVGGVCASC